MDGVKAEHARRSAGDADHRSDGSPS
jgi:hypothetical protein